MFYKNSQSLPSCPGEGDKAEAYPCPHLESMGLARTLRARVARGLSLSPRPANSKKDWISSSLGSRDILAAEKYQLTPSI